MWSHPLDRLVAARGLLLPWAPVCLAFGIGGYFALPVEPGLAEWAAIAASFAAALAWAWAAGPRWRPVALALALIAGGMLAAGGRSALVAAPVLGRHLYGPVTGRVVVIDRALSDYPRVTLDRVLLPGIARAATPARVRVTLRARIPGITPEPGQVISVTAHLSPPPGPAEPGGFDFRRMAWFDRLGATGYATSPAVLWQPASGVPVDRLRARLAEAIRARIPGQPGAFAAAVATGERSGIDRATADDLRASNLAHLLAISGLHMGLLAGFVFGALRLALAAVPPVGLRLPAKKIAAVGALGAAAAYLLLSGGSIATQRAFVMVAVMLGAVLADRRALTLRSVALAALILLIAQPESLTEPGFQMSFAATTALVAAFGALRGRGARVPKPLRAAGTLLFSSFVAGAATAPIAAATFNRIAEYGLLANLLSVPVMGLVVMPAAVIAALLAPLGLAAPVLWAMGLGAGWILSVAGVVAGLPGAVVPVPAPPAWVLPSLAMGALVAMLMRGVARLAGVGAIAVALIGWGLATRPELLIAGEGTLAGLETPAGRALSAPRGAGFTALRWLENDGDAADQAAAAGRNGFDGSPAARRFRLAGQDGIVLKGKGAAQAVADACTPGAIVITDARVPEPPRDCLLFDATSLGVSGAVALYNSVDGHGADTVAAGASSFSIRTANGVAGQRPWTAPSPSTRRRRDHQGGAAAKNTGQTAAADQ